MSGIPPGSDLDRLHGARQLDHAYGDASVLQPYQVCRKRGELCSKKVENQAAAISLHFMSCNFAPPHSDAPRTGQAPGSPNHCPWASRITSGRSWRSSPCRTRRRPTPTDSRVTRPLIQVAVSVGSIDRAGSFNCHFRCRSTCAVAVCRLVTRAPGARRQVAGQLSFRRPSVVGPLTLAGPRLTVRTRAAGTSGYLPSGGVGRWGR